MLDTLNRKLLIRYGLTQISPDPDCFSEQNGTNEVWRYKDALLLVDKGGIETKYTFSTIGTPNFKLRVKDEWGLAGIIKYINAGKTIADICSLIQDDRAYQVEIMDRYVDYAPYLEDYRYNDIGGSYFTVLSNPGIKVLMVYDRHTTKAFYYSVDDIRCLENSKSTVHTGNQTHSSISFWFLALESYINSLVKLCCIKQNLKFRDFKDQNLHTRLSFLVNLLGLDIKKFNQSGIIAKVNEFARFRNELFHDRYFGEEIEFKKTSFSGIPVLCCQVDIIQSVLIFLEVASMLRFAIKGLDTMPSVMITNRQVILWEKLDDCYSRILEPFFQAVLKKQNLSTQLDTKLPIIESFESSLFEEGEIMCRIVVDQERKYDFFLSDKVTRYVDELYHDYIQSFNLKPDTIRVDRVMLKPKGDEHPSK